MKTAILAALLVPAILAGQKSPVDELLAADRAYAAASAKTDAVSGLTPMFSAGVIMVAPTRTFAEGISKVTEAMRANPANATAKAEWTPIRGAVSPDGTHGFTFGSITLRNADG